MIQEDYITLTLEKKKNIALIAHDNEKHSLIDWCKEHREILSMHNLCGTGTTARMITDQTGLSVKGYNSGPLGGDQQIGAKIVEGKIDFVIFFSDPLTRAAPRPGCEGAAAHRAGLRHSHRQQQGQRGFHDHLLLHGPGVRA